MRSGQPPAQPFLTNPHLAGIIFRSRSYTY
jgi:hypothetical protein